MADDIVMPRLSDSMEEGTILHWMKQVGDEVAVGDELVEIETDKANMVYESDVAGTLTEILAEEGETLPIGEVIARVGDFGEGSSAGAGPATATRPSRTPRTAAEPASEAPASASPRRPAGPPRPSRHRLPRPERQATDGRVKASPLARRIAEEKGVDLATLQGSGPGGRIVKADVEKAAAAAARRAPRPRPPRAAPARRRAGPAPSSPETAKGEVEVDRAHQAAADGRPADGRVEGDRAALLPRGRDRHDAARSKRAGGSRPRPPRATSCPPSTTWSSRPARWRCASSRAPTAPTATAASSSTRGSTSASRSPRRDALVVPTVFDADRKGLRQIATEARALAAKVRDGTITPPELSGGTFTVSNLGMYGIDELRRGDQPAAGGDPRASARSPRRPVVRDGEIATAHLMGVTLACDHRILYGADGAEFLGRVRALLEEPLGLAL